MRTDAGYATKTEVLDVARRLAPHLRDRVERTEALRRLPEETVRDLIDSGLLRLIAAKHFDGSALNLDALLEVAGVIAEACPATGWVYSLWASHMWLVAQFPEHVQASVFSDPAACVSSVVNTEGAVERVEGGYVWNGKGFFSSGVDYATWLAAALDVPVEPGGLPERHWMLLPRADFDVIDDWHTIGLIGTGSNTVIAENVFIPDHHALSAHTLSEGKGPGARLHDAPLYRAPIDFVFSLALSGAQLGIARAAVREFEDLCRERFNYPNSRVATEQAASLMRFAHAGAEVAAAEALLLSDAAYFGNLPASEATLLDRARCRRDVAFATQMCRRAVNDLFESGGGSHVFAGSGLQRLWRDSNVASAHHGLMWDIHGLAYGRVAAGLPTVLDPIGI